ncbi:MAG: molybdopterin molybdotransferase MoeA [Deltaproteobacteria bacterium]|jgi:molybdopterin molybdotransferase|nr:molybdopterin molybdotransferase MoeA [Deltaproteobacteria bacterium]
MALSFEAARTMILESVIPLPPEAVSLLDVVGMVIAEDIRAAWDMPLWNNSAMDGFAVRAEDCVAGQTLTVDGYIPAGGSASGINVKPGGAVKIMTGAPAPAGCDAIVPIEETVEKNGKLILTGQVRPGDHLRIRGEDVSKGELVIAAGTALRPAEINMLASFGYRTAPVFRRPKVAILSTGDELVEPGEDIGTGQIFNSNDYSIAAAVKQLGGEPVLLGIARDDRQSLTEKIAAGLEEDLLITTAGVSMGDHDLVCDVLEVLQVERRFWKVDIKPGRPTAFGLKNGKPVFSLPGNPVSSMITFEQFVRPALLKMMGHQRVIEPLVRAVMQETIKKKPGRVQFLRVRVAKDGQRLVASSSGDQNTGILRTLLRANGIAVLPADLEQLRSGEEVDVQLIAAVDIV